MSNLTLLIPAKYEFESLPIFLKELDKFDHKKIVILDQNDIETINAAKQFNDVEILFQKKKGINYTKTEFFSIINADGSMNPNELNIMLDEIVKNDQDIVFGSRYMKNAGSEDDDLITTVGNFIFSFIGKFFFNLKISVILYTYVLGKTKLVKDFKFCIELPIKAHRFNYNYTSYPCYERKRIAGKKKVSPFLDGLRILFGMIFLFFKRN